MKSINTKLPAGLGAIHFIGIGGIGMSGIAEVLLSLGYSIQGSDAKSSEITKRLSSLGAKVFIGHERVNLNNAEVVVISSAIKDGNIELQEAYLRLLPVVSRAEMLAELMRLKSNIAVAGTHGKTTTTTMVSAVLDSGGIDPTVINGGIIHAYGSNARMGQGEWMVVEADESDGTFTRLPATIGVITNIDPEHMEHWESFENLHNGFFEFISNIPFYGVAVCCIDDIEVKKLISRIKNRKVITFGFDKQADIRAVNINYKNGRSIFDIILKDNGRTIRQFSLPMPGDYNVSNALAAVAVANYLGMSFTSIKEAIKNFKGVNRRFTKVGEIKGITIIDDYGHHPVEISAVLRAARQITSGSVIAVHEPHRFSRLSNLFEDFCNCFRLAEHVVITEIYSAGEDQIHGLSNELLVEGIIKTGHNSAHAISGLEALSKFILSVAKRGDVVIFLGAGSISSWANSLPSILSEKTNNSLYLLE
jgi:UDP-N-acetylmuramate--alanine ligase